MKAVETLGCRLLVHPENGVLRSRLGSGKLDHGDFSCHVVHVVYGMLFHVVTAGRWSPSGPNADDFSDCEIGTADLLETARVLGLTADDDDVLGPFGTDELAEAYESLLELRPAIDVEAGTLELHSGPGHRRKATGAYYTPDVLIDCLLDLALDLVLDEAAARPTPAEARRAILDLTVCDPACGSGRFLIAAARRMARRLATLDSTCRKPRPETVGASLRDVVARCIYGVDRDPVAVELARLGLWLESSTPGELGPLLGVPRLCQPCSAEPRHGRDGRGTALEEHIQCGDSLLGSVPVLLEAQRQGGFDVVLGNPPFVNMIDGGIPPAAKERLRDAGADLGPTADLAFHFVGLSHAIARPRGRIGLVLPKTFLNAESAVRLRERLGRERPPTAIYVPKRATFFGGVSAYVCLVVLGGEGPCLVSDDERPGTAAWKRGAIGQANWWRSAQAVLGGPDAVPNDGADDARVPLSGRFELSASMTAAEAYRIRPHLKDAESGGGLRLVTTGLIDPFTCRWGEKACRYLGSTWAHPRIARHATFPAALNRRLDQARRPKILLAGLCNRLEAFLDAPGRCIGAVSTFSIYHPADSIEALEGLCRWLNSPEATSQVQAELGAASVGGGYMTLKKATLKRLSVPSAIGKPPPGRVPGP